MKALCKPYVSLMKACKEQFVQLASYLLYAENNERLFFMFKKQLMATQI